MSGFDKFLISERLERLGWVEITVIDEDGCGEVGYVPPDNLWQKKPETFPVYEAEQLQSILGRAI